eukprot:TRINITY_DN4316_c0_g1_i1.p2 TRINITY_DN4316_c0_g1~~TRINITY_DN4316_c0_g1_i1.p2  ORF type:complete len:137 (-),score=20.36 TRINITY_DN4316_c0_g1_i1:245-655(-)
MSLFGGSSNKYSGDVEFWHGAEKDGWLMKQGQYIKTWRRRFFVLKQGKIFWFKTNVLQADSIPRGVIEVSKCLSIKGAEEIINREFAFEVVTVEDSMYFIADNEKEKEEWINAVGKAVVKHSRSLLDSDQADYTSG